MGTIEVCLGIIILFTSTCFGYSVGKNVGFKEGMQFCAELMSHLTFNIQDDEEESGKK